MTNRAKHHFTVKEHVIESPGQEPKVAPWIYVELVERPDLPILSKGFLGFDLRDGATRDEAEELAERLNQLVKATTYTDPHGEAARIGADIEDQKRRKKEGRLH